MPEALGILGGGALGTLFVRLVGDATRLIKGMKDGEDAVQSGAAQMTRQLNNFSKVAAGAFVAAAGTVAFFTKQSINAADQMAKTAQSAGQTVEQFSALAFSADLAHVNVTELAQSSKFLAQWMEKTGKNAGDLTEEIIKQADEFANMEDGANKVRMAVERFGRAGAALIPFLNQGSAAIRAQMEEARLLGQVVGPEFARDSQQYNDNLTRINAAFKGIFNVIAAELLPAWIDMQERFIAWIKETDAVHVAAGFLLEVYDNLTFAVKRFALGVLTVWTALKSFGTLIGSAVAIAVEILMEKVNSVIQLFGAWWDTIKGIIGGLAKMATVAELAAKAVSATFKGDLAGAAEAAKAIPKAMSEGWDEIANSVKRGVTTAGEIVTNSFSKDAGIVSSISKSTIEDLTEQWTDFLNQGDALLQPVEVRAKAVQNTVKTITQDIESNSQKAKELLEKVGRPTLSAFDPFTSQSFGVMKEQAEAESKLKILEEFAARKLQLTDEMNAAVEASMDAHHQKLRQLQAAQTMLVLQSGQGMFDALGQAAKGFAGEQSDLYKAMFAASKAFAIAESIVKIQQGVANALSLPWPSNLIAAASVVAAAANIVSTISAVSLQFGGERAMGGPVVPGKAFLVGEKGPELFSPSQRGSIIPNDQMGSKVVINNFTDTTPQVTERNDGTGRIIEVVLKRAKNDIAAEIRDGRGDINRSLENSFKLRRG